MRVTKFLILAIFTSSIIIALDRKIGQFPPIGRFLDPFHGFWQNSEKKSKILSPYQIPFLREPVSVRYDENLIPHIFAQNENDLFIAQGFITAQHRLWQMDFQTYAASGRLSEIIGDAAINFDRLQRRNGMLFAADNSVRALDNNESASSILSSYTTGVNAFISSLKYKDLPIEYKLLDYRPEQWSPLKTALLLKYMSNDLSGWDADLENTNIVHIFGKETFDFLFPDYMEGIDPVIPEGTEWDFEPIHVQAPEEGQEYPGRSLLSTTISKPDPDNGSNNWAISGIKTANGNPLLANDPHLNINLPSLWFVMQLKSPEINVMGASLPGAPGVVIGFNENISWGVTNATRDVRDWYHIQFRDKQRLEYLFDNRWLKTQRTIEEIKVRNGSNVYDTVVYTHHGPVVYDHSYPERKEPVSKKINYALKWTAHEESMELLTFYLLNKGRNYQDYLNALAYYQNPAQNFAFASKAGDIALWIQGKFPVKWEGQGKFLMDGSNPLHEWQAYIPNEQNAHSFNPERGFVSSANQHPVDGTYPYYVYDANYEFYRNRRINSTLSQNDSLTVEDMMALQNDNFNLKASEILPTMMENVALENLNTRQKEIFDLMKTWNFFNEVNMQAPSVFEVWWDKLYHSIWDEFENDTLALMKPNSWRTIKFIKENPDHEFMDMLSTSHQENASDLISSTFYFAVDSIDRWVGEKELDFTWGNFKATRAQHLLRQNAFSIDNIPVGGNRNIVNANSKRHGASWRMIVELGEETKAWGIYPGGQSGNPGSQNYDNFIEKWAAGEYIQLLFMKDVQDRSNEIILTQELYPNEVVD